MKVPTPPNPIALALAEVAAVPRDARGRRRWRACPEQVAQIVRLYRASGHTMTSFAREIGMPQTILSRCDRGVDGHDRVWRALRRLVPPRETAKSSRSRVAAFRRNASAVLTAAEAPMSDASHLRDVRLLDDSSIEVVELRIVPYGSEEHARLLPLASRRTGGRLQRAKRRLAA